MFYPTARFRRKDGKKAGKKANAEGFLIFARARRKHQSATCMIEKSRCEPGLEMEQVNVKTLMAALFIAASFTLGQPDARADQEYEKALVSSDSTLMRVAGYRALRAKFQKIAKGPILADGVLYAFYPGDRGDYSATVKYGKSPRFYVLSDDVARTGVYSPAAGVLFSKDRQLLAVILRDLGNSPTPYFTMTVFTKVRQYYAGGLVDTYEELELPSDGQ